MKPETETSNSLLTPEERQKLRAHFHAGNGVSPASRRGILGREVHQKQLMQTRLLSQQQDPQVSVCPQDPVQPGHTASPPEPVFDTSQWATSKSKKGPLRPVDLAALTKKAQTDRSFLTRAERQQLRSQKAGGYKWTLAADVNRTGNLAPFQRPYLSRKKQANAEQHQQKRDQLSNLPNAVASFTSPYSDFPPCHNPPPHPATTPPPASTFHPSSIASYHAHPASLCPGCNVDLAAIERTTAFNYPAACPLCHTPRPYLPDAQDSPRAPRAMLQQQGNVNQNWDIVLVNPLAGNYIPAPIKAENRNFDGDTVYRTNTGKQSGRSNADISVHDKKHRETNLNDWMNGRPHAKRAKLAEEQIGDEGKAAEWVSDKDIDNGVDENVEDELDMVIEDEEDWEQRGWDGMYEEDEEVALNSEDEV